MLVLFFVNELHLSPSGVGAVMMMGSCGGLVGATMAASLARRIGTGRASTILLLIGGAAALLIGLPSSGDLPVVSIVGMILVGAAVVAGNVIRSAWRQRFVPAHLMGRVITASQMLNFGTMPVAAIAAGWMGANAGIRTTILFMAGIHAIACWSILFTTVGRHKNLPSFDPSDHPQLELKV